MDRFTPKTSDKDLYLIKYNCQYRQYKDKCQPGCSKCRSCVFNTDKYIDVNNVNERNRARIAAMRSAPSVDIKIKHEYKREFKNTFVISIVLVILGLICF